MNWSPAAVSATVGAVAALLTGVGITLAATQLRIAIQDRRRSQASNIIVYCPSDAPGTHLSLSLINASDTPILGPGLLIQTNNPRLGFRGPAPPGDIVLTRTDRGLRWYPFNVAQEVWLHGVKDCIIRHWVFGRSALISFQRIESGLIEPGCHPVELYFSYEEHPADPLVSVGIWFVDSAGRTWTRRLDGQLFAGKRLSNRVAALSIPERKSRG
jgi:hypothetical protein